LGDPAFRPVLDELNRRGAVVHVHPTPPCCQSLVPDTDPLKIEYNTDTSRAIWTMIKDSGSASDVTARYSKIRFVWSHAGGTLLGLVGRFLGAYSFTENLQGVAAPNSRLYHLRRFYYDTAGSFSPVQMQALKTSHPHSVSRDLSVNRQFKRSSCTRRTAFSRSANSLARVDFLPPSCRRLSV
jgi:hypothetical protein